MSTLPKPMKLPGETLPDGWRLRSFIIISGLATGLNFLLILTLCFFIGPRVDDTILEVARNREIVQHNL